MRQIIPIALLVTLLIGVGGCGYTAIVHNESQQTVVAEIRHDRFLMPSSTPGSARLRPGESATLGPYKIDPLEPIYLRVRAEGDVFGSGLEKRLEPGDQVFYVEDGTLQSWESFSLRRGPPGG